MVWIYLGLAIYLIGFIFTWFWTGQEKDCIKYSLWWPLFWLVGAMVYFKK